MTTTTTGGTIVMVGTRKGLWIGRSDEAREEWEFTGPHFDMEEVYSCMVDPRVGDGTHIAFSAESPAMVDAFYQAALAAGGTDNGAPGHRHYHPDYYGAFVRDPDGINVEAVCHAPQART